MEQKNPIQVAGRLFRTLELLAETGSAGLMELSSGLELNKTTAHRVLNSLIYMGYARQNPVSGKYEPTFKIVDMANKIMAKVDIVQTVRPYLRKLMEATGETVHFVERDGIDAVYIDKVESLNNGIQMVSRIGSRIPLYCSGVGKAMVAGMDLMYFTDSFGSSTGYFAQAYFCSALMYFIICYPLARLARYLEIRSMRQPVAKVKLEKMMGDSINV